MASPLGRCNAVRGHVLSTETGSIIAAVGPMTLQVRKSDAARCRKMIWGTQVNVARTLLGWSVRDLARRTGLDIADIQELESAAKASKRQRDDLALIQAILEEVGIEFIESVGVQFRPPGLGDITLTERASGDSGSVPGSAFRAPPA